FQLRQHLEQIPHQPDVRDLEDRCLGVLVDRHDRAGVLDAGQVLDRAADADGDVQVGGDDLAGLADLQFVGNVAGVDRGARGADGGAELVGEVEDDLEVFFGTDAAATGDHALGALQVRTVGFAGGQADVAGVRGQGRLDAGRFHRRAAAAGRFRPGRG